MFATLKQIFAPTNSDLRKRILFTLGALLIFIIGTGVPVPGTTNITKNLGFLELINAMGGGGLKNFSIFALGVSPYITASIIIQLLEMDIIPYFSELSKEGPVGRRKLNQITRYVGIVFAFIEGYAFSFAFLGASSAFEYLYVATILTAGTAFCLWLGDQITQKGIGNGISLMIMAGIIATLPTMFQTAFTSLVVPNDLVWGIVKFAIFVILYFVIIIGVIYVQEAERRIPLQYANKTTGSYGSEQSFLPIKLNTASVIPVIFASSLLAIPATIANFVNKEGFTNFVSTYLDYSKPVGFILYIVLIFFFGYFYTFLQLKPEDVADNLKNNGGYIPGVRPGKETEEYVSHSLSRVTIVGTILLIILAIIPIIFTNVTKLPSSISIGGTGLLIVVGVALETYKQLEGSLATRTYKKRKGRLR
ncbi:MAG: preprotein translocase subunit SecY [Erysipelotrichaceae bacterium]|nr:preprotein translocase subunit SecY [Erysipelotrichaceae bacterium]